MTKNTVVKKSLCIALAAATCIGVAGCSGVTEDSYDETKVQFFIAVENNGYGYAYLEEMNKRFEEKYKDYDFGNGKIGIEVKIDTAAGFGSAEIRNSKNSIYYTSGWRNYYNLVAENVLMDITDAVRADLGDYGESGKTVESKLVASRSDLVDQYKTSADKYYALPLDGAGAYGIIYDVDLFENNSLYYQKGGCPSEYTRGVNCKSTPLDGTFSNYRYTNGKTSEKSAGPDGEYGTKDDGLPATYEEFYNLCDYMVEKKSITPFTWSGGVASSYFQDFAYQSYADVEGENGLNIMKNFSGSEKLGRVDTSGNFVLDSTITDFYLQTDSNGKVTDTNAYEVARQPGMYYAIKFWQEIFNRHNGDYYTTQSRSGYESQTQAQSTYLYSTHGSNPVAFLCDGTWWQNEATDSFNALVQTYGESQSKTSRRFGVLALPKPSAEYIGGKFTSISNGGLVFVNAQATGIAKDLALEYIKFQCTDVSLKKFVEIVGTVRPFDLTLSETELSGLTNYTQELYYYLKNGSFVTQSVGSDLQLNHFDFFKARSILNGQTYISPYAAFDAGKLGNNADVATYFNSVCARYEDYWKGYIINK